MSRSDTEQFLRDLLESKKGGTPISTQPVLSDEVTWMPMLVLGSDEARFNCLTELGRKLPSGALKSFMGIHLVKGLGSLGGNISLCTKALT